MKILKYKKKANGKYSVLLEDGREFVYYEETILRYNLLLKKEISEGDLLTIYQTNLEYDVYYVALNNIKNHYKSTFELREFLLKKNYPTELVDLAIEKLQQQKYLDDRAFAKSFIHTQMATTSHGPERIKKDLFQKKVDSSIVEEEICVYDEELQKEKIHKLIDKELKTNHSRGGVVLKQKIYNDLKTQGYDSELISLILSQYDFSCDKSIAKKEYEKLYKKYSSKYEGYALKKIIREKLFQKGLSYEEE